MLLLSCRQIRKSYGEVEVLRGVDLDICVDDRIGIIGRNGSGKSTLAEIIAGQLRPDGGEMTWWQAGVRVGYLRQSAGDRGLCDDQVCSSPIEPTRLEAAEGPGVPGGAHESGHFLETMSRLGLDQADQWADCDPGVLSGGERTKLALAAVWSTEPDVLLLDEPTNHMDFRGVEWLISQLTAYKGAILIVSHDRYLLDQVTTRTVEIDDGTAKTYDGNYSFYRGERERIRAAQLKMYEEMRREHRRIEKEIERVRRWSAKAHREAGTKSDIRKGVKEFERSKAKRMDRQVKSRIKRLEQLRRDGPARPKDEPEVRFSLQGTTKHGRRIAIARGISKSYSGRVLFLDSSFYIQRGDKVGLFGPNGCGKTTLFRIIVGDECPDEGEIWISPSARVGYLSQGNSSLKEEETVLEVLGLSTRRFESRARGILAQMGIGDDLVHKPICALSSGERAKAEVARLVLSETDLLLLDEPTNHLDVYSREQLEEALKAYDGTVIMASHDRYLLEAVCNRMLLFEEGKLKRWEG